MFLELIDNKDMLWEFRLIGDVTITSRVTGYVKDSMGHPITIEVGGGRITRDIPWTAIITITHVDK